MAKALMYAKVRVRMGPIPFLLLGPARTSYLKIETCLSFNRRTSNVMRMAPLEVQKYFDCCLNPICLIITESTEITMTHQGLTLRFQARGPKGFFDENKWSKTGFLVIFQTILGP